LSAIGELVVGTIFAGSVLLVVVAVGYSVAGAALPVPALALCYLLAAVAGVVRVCSDRGRKK
jgi:hypothetical protein